LGHGLLEIPDTVGFDLLALRLLLFALNAEAVFLHQIVLLDFAIDRRNDGLRQLEPEHQRIVEDEHFVERNAIVIAVLALLLGPLNHALAEHGFGVRANALLNLLPLDRIDLFGGVFGDDLARPVADFRT